MAFCAKCGAALTEGATFCGSCGAPAGAAGGTPGAGTAAASSAMASNVAATLSYVLGFITGVLFLVLDPYKNDKFVRFHSFQSIFFSVANIAFWILFSILSSILTTITLGFGALILLPLVGLIGLAIFVYWIFLMYKAYNNERYMIPFIGGLAAKQAGQA